MSNPTVHRDDHSRFLIRRLAHVAIVGHVAILIAALAAEIRPLVLINLASISLYVLCLVLNLRRWYGSVLVLGLIEVTAHAALATWLLSWASGFHIYVICLIPLVFFLDTTGLGWRLVLAILIAGFYVALAWFAHTFIPTDPRPFIIWFRYGNLLTGGMVIAGLSYYYGRVVKLAQIALEAKNQELHEIARTDALTGLPNRREASHLLEMEVTRSTRSTEPFALVLADVDHFKKVNDELGHDAGDEVLKRIASILRRALRAQDTVARWGGEEFLCILPQTDDAGAVVAAEKARAAVEADANGITITLGISVYASGRGIGDLLKDADVALYKGKEYGRNRVVPPLSGALLK